MKRGAWDPDEDAVLIARYADTETRLLIDPLQRSVSSIYDRAEKLGLKKTKALISELSKRANAADRGGRFQPGLVPWNKGRRCPGLGGGATQFKRGGVPMNHKPMGHERINAEGYRERKVRDDASSRTRVSNYRAVRVLVWEQHHGPAPAGHAVVFRNGDRSDLRIENLECIKRAELMKRNSFHRWPEEIRGVIHAKARLTRVIHELESKSEE